MKFERLFALIFLLSALAFPATAQEPGWRLYENPAWGYRIQYPEQLLSVFVEVPENGGATISTPDGQARLSLFGGPNVRGGSTNELADDLSRVQDFHAVTYRRVTRNWIVLSGYLSDETGAATDTIFYQRIDVSPSGERIVGFSLEYPIVMRAAVDDLIGPMGRSLRVD